MTISKIYDPFSLLYLLLKCCRRSLLIFVRCCIRLLSNVHLYCYRNLLPSMKELSLNGSMEVRFFTHINIHISIYSMHL